MKYILILLLLLPLTVTAIDVAGTFDPPITRADGTTLLPSEIEGFNVYVNGVKLDPPLPATTYLPSDSTGFPLTLPAGTHTIGLTAVDTDGLEGDAAEVIVSGNFPPGVPLNFIILRSDQ